MGTSTNRRESAPPPEADGEMGPWDTIPPNLVHYLVQDKADIYKWRLMNKNWCKEVDMFVQTAKVDELELVVSLLSPRAAVRKLREKFPRMVSISCSGDRKDWLTPLSDYWGDKLESLKIFWSDNQRWELLPQFSRLKSLEIQCGVEGRDKGLHCISSLTMLTELVFSFVEVDNVDFIEELTNLERLVVDVKSMLPSLDFLAPLRSLVELDLGSFSFFRERNVFVFTNLTNLRSFKVGFLGNNDSVVASLGCMSDLQVLHLNDSMVGSVVFDYIQSMSNLRELSIMHVNVMEHNMEVIASLTDLESLCIGSEGRKLDCEYGERLCGLQRLQTLRCHYLVRDEQLEGIALLQALTHLHLDVSLIANDAFFLLEILENLETLHLDNGFREDGTTLVDWGCIPKLRSLVLMQKDWTDASLVHLSRLTALEELSLRFSNTTDEGMRLVANLQGLTCFVNWSMNTSDSALEVLTRLTNLRDAEFTRMVVTQKGMQHLTNLQGLTRLHINALPDFDARMQDLSVLTNLRRLHIRCQCIPLHSARNVTRMVPNCKGRLGGSEPFTKI